MRNVTVKMLIEFGESRESVDFVVRVPDDWEYNEDSTTVLYRDFRSEAVLDIEDVECCECGYTIGQCGCDEECDEEEE